MQHDYEIFLFLSHKGTAVKELTWFMMKLRSNLCTKWRQLKGFKAVSSETWSIVRNSLDFSAKPATFLVDSSGKKMKLSQLIKRLTNWMNIDPLSNVNAELVILSTGKEKTIQEAMCHAYLNCNSSQIENPLLGAISISTNKFFRRIDESQLNENT